MILDLCPAKFTYVPRANRCYHIDHTTPRNFTSARTYCQGLAVGADFAQLQTNTETNSILHLVYNSK